MNDRPALWRRWWVLLLVFVAVLVGCGTYQWWWLPRVGRAESCANCRSFVRFFLSDYARTHDGWYPRGGATPLDSLALCVEAQGQVHHFTSHGQSVLLKAYWNQHHTLAPELTCYRYNEGLRIDDPPDKVVLHFFRSTTWECNLPVHRHHPLGRPVMMNDHSWTFLPEAEFQKRQAETLAYLEQRGRLRKPSPAP